MNKVVVSLTSLFVVLLFLVWGAKCFGLVRMQYILKKLAVNRGVVFLASLFIVPSLLMWSMGHLNIVQVQYTFKNILAVGLLMGCARGIFSYKNK